MKVNQATHSVGVMCRLLRISRSGFYAWLERPMSARRRADLALMANIEAIHRRSRVCLRVARIEPVLSYSRNAFYRKMTDIIRILFINFVGRCNGVNLLIE